MFHSNIKGGFLCSAPNGSCAPTSLIDDGAIRDIRQNEKSDKGGDLVLPSATPSPMGPDAIIYPADRPGKDGMVTASLSGRALKVVYPAHLGSAGKVVPKRIAYALVDLPEWQEVVTADGRVTDAVSHGLLGAAQNAPDALMMVSAAANVPGASPSSIARGDGRSADAPIAKASTAQIDAIKAQADQIWHGPKVRTAGTFPPEAN
jgi:conjugal transfer pilus assembly protein TraV